MEKRLAVLGSKVAHSRSPLIHRAWLAEHKISARYDAITIDEGDDFSHALSGLFTSPDKKDALYGANITIPYKEKAYEFVRAQGGDVDVAASALGALNLLYYNDGRLCGGNTDGAGFLAALKQAGVALGAEARAPVVVWGAGGAARAILMALIGAGFDDIRLVNRTSARAQALCEALMISDKVKIFDWQARDKASEGAGLLVNASSLGMMVEASEENQRVLGSVLAPLNKNACVCDIVYTPLATDLLEAARARDLRGIDGLGMLLHQAALSFERWFGILPEVNSDLRELLIKDL